MIHPDHLKTPPDPVLPIPTPVTDAGGNHGGGNDDPTLPPPPPKITKRYFGRASLDPLRANKDMGIIVEEVIERLTGLTGCDVEIKIEIQAHLPAGFDEATIRTVSENSRTLKFEQHGFETD